MFIADNIRFLRKNAGYSQNDLAEILGYDSFTTIQKWESGISTPPLGTFARMSELFGVSMDDIAGKDLRKEAEPRSRSEAADCYTLRIDSDLLGQLYNENDILYLERQSVSGSGQAIPVYSRLCLQEDQMILHKVDEAFYAEPAAFDTVCILRVLKRKV